MRVLPLYPTKPVLAIEGAEAQLIDRKCIACSLSTKRRNVVGAEGEPGGLLIVGEGPGRNEDELNRPFVGASGKLMRTQLAKYWRGPVAIDNALRCYPAQTEIKPKNIEACRGYLAETIEEVRPTRIVSLGKWANFSLTGRSVPPFTSRGAYTYLLSGRWGQPIPLFFVLHPAAALRNRFVRQWFELDMMRALTLPDPPLPPLKGTVRVVETASDARAAVAALRAGEWVAFDVETAGVIYDTSFRLLCISLCSRGSEDAWGWDWAALQDPRTRDPLVAFLNDPTVRKLGSNVKYDEISCDIELGVKPAGVEGDIRLWRKVQVPEAEGKLERMVELVGMGGMKEEADDEMAAVVERVKKALEAERRIAKNLAKDAAAIAANQRVKKRAPTKAVTQAAIDYLHEIDETMPWLAPVVRDPDRKWGQWAYALVPPDMLMRYNGRDTVGTARLGAHLETGFATEPELDRVRKVLVEPVARSIRAIERWGVPCDRNAIHRFDQYLGAELAPIEAAIVGYAGEDFNPRSTDQVREFMFKKLGLAPIKFTDSEEASTDKETLIALEKQHPFVKALVEYRRLTTLRSRYAGGMLRFVRPDGRIHTSLLVDGTETGRFSSADPNLQNIPRPQSVEGRMARNCFATDEDHIFVELDYSQIELRIAAMMAQDELMLDIFARGEDLHQRTAEIIAPIAWGIRADQVTEEHRSRAKSVNFGIVYGKTAVTFAREWGISIAKAQRIVDAIMGTFKKLAAWCERMRAETMKTGVSWTWWDGMRARRRNLYRIADQDDVARSTANNAAVNTPVQGTASDFSVASIGALTEWIETEDLESHVKLVLPVHDSVLFDVRLGFQNDVIAIGREIMTSWNSNGVPLKVDAKVGRRWGELEKVAA